MSPTTTAEHAEQTGPTPVSVKESAIEAIVDVAQHANSVPSFLKLVLPVIAEHLSCAHASLEVHHGGTLIRESWTHENSDEQFWSTTVEDLLTDTIAEPATRARIFQGDDNELRIAFLCTPFGVHGRHGGALVVVMPCRDEQDVDTRLELLDVLATLATSLVETVRRDHHQTSVDPHAASDSSVGQIQKVAAFTSEIELAFAITNKLRTREACEQVALSAVNGHKVRLLAVSGNDSVAPRSPGVKLLRAAIEECVDLRKTIIDQPKQIDGDSTVVCGGRLHHAWRESTGGGCVGSIPIFHDEDLVAVLSMRRSSSSPFEAEALEELRSLVEPYASGLEMVRVARRSLPQHLASATKQTVSGWFQPSAWGRKAFAISLAAFVTWGFYGTIPYTVQAPCELVPATSRQLAAASDGVLAETFVSPGDIVAKGDLLCRFDTSEMELERARLDGELAILSIDRYRALSAGTPAEYEMAAANARAMQANLDLVNYRINAASVYATIGGTILEGDHRSRIGDAFAKGEALYQIAPSEGWKLSVQVSESDIAFVEAGMTGTFSSHSRPEDSTPFHVARIAPSAEQREGHNVFELEAVCDIPPTGARSGMAGFAAIDADDRTPAWVAFHRAIDFARLHLWL